MIRFPLLGIAVCGALSSTGQGFSVVNVPEDDRYDLAHTVRTVPQGYLMFSTKGDSAGYHGRTTLFDPQGTVLTVQDHGDLFSAHWGLQHAISQRLADGGFVGLSVSATTQGARMLVYRFNDEGDTLWTRWLDTAYAALPRAAVAQDGSYYFAGLRKLSSSDITYETFILRTDTQGYLLAQESFPDLPYDKVSLCAGVPGELYLAAGNSTAGAGHRAHVVALDTALSVRWSNDIVESTSDQWPLYRTSVAGMAVDAGGDVLLGGMCVNLNVYPIWIPMLGLVKIDREDGSLLWARRHAITSSDLGTVNDLAVLQDGSMVVCGFVVPPNMGFRAFIAKYTANGTQVWIRYHRYLTNALAENVLLDVELLDNGGFALAGTTRLHFIYGEVPWLLVLDAEGCLLPGCLLPTDIEETEASADGGLRIWPLPIGTESVAEINVPIGRGSAEMRVVDGAGRCVQAVTLVGVGLQSVPIGTWSFAAGIHVVQVVQDGRVLTSERIVVP